MKAKNSSLTDIKNFIDLNQGNVCYLSGDDPFFTEEATDFIKDKKLDESSRDFNYEVFYGHETGMGHILNIIRTFPITAKERLVIIRQAHQLRDTDWKILSPILIKPVSSTFLVFTGDKPDRRKKIIKKILESMTHFHFTRPYEREFPKWIKSICKKHSVEIEPDVPDLLLQIVGPNLMDLKNEILKLGHYTGRNKKVSPPDVMTVTSRIKLQNIFDLTDAIGRKDQARALLCLADLIENGQNEVGIVAMVHRHIRLLRQTIIGQKKDLPHRELASFAGVPPFLLKEYLSQTRFWSEQKIKKTYNLLCDTDRALKSSPLSNHIWLEHFIIQTCQKE